MPRALLPCLCACLLAACTTFAAPTESQMSFATMQSLNPGVDGEWILAEYPYARDVTRRPGGRLQSMGYWVQDPQGTSRPLMLHFDAQGRLVRKEYGGPLVRPPEPTGSAAPFSLGS